MKACVCIPVLLAMLQVLSAAGLVIAIDEVREHPIYEPDDVAPLDGSVHKTWSSVGPGLNVAFGSTDVRYARHLPPEAVDSKECEITAWRGERINTQIVLWTAEGARQVRPVAGPLRSDSGMTIPETAVRLRFVRYVLADEGPESPQTLKLVPDVLDTGDRIDVPRETTRPVWLSLDVPCDVPVGRYRGSVKVTSEGGETTDVSVVIEVVAPVLPPPSQWKFRLDIWQNPWAVAHQHGVAPWSEAHMKVLEPHLIMLAESGQKFVTTYLTPTAWGESTFINNETMVEWIRLSDGSWRYDYEVFDRWVETVGKAGITQAITCYFPGPWGHRVRYRDERTGDEVWTQAKPGTPEFTALWTPMLRDLADHLRRRGWFDRTYIGINENPVEEGRECIKLVRSVAPGLKITWAGLYHEELKDEVDDWCFFIDPPVKPDIITERSRRGCTTTFYTCCGPLRPNNFTFSPPAESAWMGWYAAAQGYDGFLRWAYDSWSEKPLTDTRYVRWPAGDCFLVYPGPRSSIRWERLREGIVDFEKIRILRDRLRGRQELGQLEEALKRFDYSVVQHEPAAVPIQHARNVLDRLSRIVVDETEKSQPGIVQ